MLPLIELRLTVQLKAPATFLRTFQQCNSTLRTLQLTGFWTPLSDQEYPGSCARKASERAWLQICNAQARLQLPPTALEAGVQTMALRSLTLRQVAASDATIAWALKRMSSLRVLDMSDCHNVGAACCARLPTTLRSLKLHRCGGVDQACLTSFSTLAALQSLQLQDVPAVCSGGALWLAQQRGFHLTDLTFSMSTKYKSSGATLATQQCGALTDSAARALVASLPGQHPTLQHLSLDGHTDLGSATVQALLSARIPLKLLSLNNTGIRNRELVSLATRLPHLRLLHVSACRHLSRSAFELAKLLATNQRGEDALSLWAVDLEDDPADPDNWDDDFGLTDSSAGDWDSDTGTGSEDDGSGSSSGEGDGSGSSGEDDGTSGSD